MLRPSHRRRSSTMDSLPSHPGRRRRESLAGAAGDSMDVVHDEREDQARDHQQQDTRSSPFKLRGRGGFSHPQGAGRGRGANDQAAIAGKVGVDPIDKLASEMSALHFVPHSVRVARGRGRGRGG